MSEAARQRAERMGTRAGELFRDYGVPSRCPFDRRGSDDLAELAIVFDRAYLAAAKPQQ